MAMPIPQAITTIDELMALPEDSLRHELLDGVHVVTPTPRPLHQRAVRELFLLLHDLDARLMERWHPDDARPEIVDGILRWSLPGNVSGEIDLPGFFHRILDA